MVGETVIEQVVAYSTVPTSVAGPPSKLTGPSDTVKLVTLVTSSGATITVVVAIFVLTEFFTVAVNVYVTDLVVLVFSGMENALEKLPPVHVGDHGAPVRVGLTVMVQVDAPMTAPLMVTWPPGPLSVLALELNKEMERGSAATVTVLVLVTVPTLFRAAKVKV